MQALQVKTSLTMQVRAISERTRSHLSSTKCIYLAGTACVLPCEARFTHVLLSKNKQTPTKYHKCQRCRHPWLGPGSLSQWRYNVSYKPKHILQTIVIRFLVPARNDTIAKTAITSPFCSSQQKAVADSAPQVRKHWRIWIYIKSIWMDIKFSNANFCSYV